MPRIKIALALAILLSVLLTVAAPARLLGLVLPAERVLVQGFSGTLWRGSATRCIVALGHGYLHLGKVNWRLSPLSLLTLSPRLQLESQWGAQTISGIVKLYDKDNFNLENIDATVSAQLVREFTPLGVDGSLSAQLEHLEVVDGLPVTGSGQMVWQRATWLSVDGPVLLGSYAVDFQETEDETLSGEIITLTGPIQASGVVSMSGRDYEVNVLLDRDIALNEQLQQAISLLAQPVDEGFRIQLTGSL